ncbi:glycosyltransferase family 2 protein [Parasutterella secunda]|uniref:glycosyltransferase family 2 protein n=1 Tax=Parasutterella secunda TaxID=626947 RepID=UPI0025A3D454|nr:glycosyltransferase [Parasutterella secunda]MDM8218952.1 glycosyltransferase [Parasutterella secunda]
MEKDKIKNLNPLVSIVIPCYNSERYIDECIQSVLNQTYSNWELLLIDDCSTDSTYAKILKYSTNDPRIKLFQTTSPSGGPSHPRNIGLSQAKGSYISFLDSDDLWLPNKLSEQIKYIQKYNVSFVYSNYEKITPSGEKSGRHVTLRPYVSYPQLLLSCEIPCLTALIDSFLIKQKLFRETGKEDYLLWLQILKSGVIAYNCGETLALYREGHKSRSRNKLKMIFQQWVILRDFEKVNFFKSCYCLIYYIIKGLKKYLK